MTTVFFDVESPNGRGHAMKVLKQALEPSGFKLSLVGGGLGRSMPKVAVDVPEFSLGIDLDGLNGKIDTFDDDRVKLYPVGEDAPTVLTEDTIDPATVPIEILMVERPAA